jgi:Zn-finger protein
MPDCDELLENGKCKLLKVPTCRGNDCSFIHKKGSYEKVYARLRLLPEEKQKHIAKKYYNGDRPWAESEEQTQG